MIRAVLERPLRVLLGLLLVTLVLGVGATGTRFDNTPETWIPMAGDDVATYQAFRDRFGEDSLIVVFAGDARAADPLWRQSFDDLARGLRELSGVSWVEAPAWTAGPALSALPARLPAEQAAAALPSLLAAALVNREGSAAAIAVYPEPGQDAAERSGVVTRIEAYVAAADARLGRLQLAGADVITHDLDLGSQQSLGGLSPLVLGTMCLIFFFATRSARAVGAMLLAVVTASVWTLGLVALSGRTLNLVVVVMPAILAVVTAAQATHLLSRFSSLDAWSDASDPQLRRRGWSQAIGACWRPCLLSALTTAAGFASLAISDIPPIRDLGAFTALGVLFSFVLTFTLIPALLVRSPRVAPRPAAARRWTPERAERYAAGLRRAALPIAAAFAALAVLGGIGLQKLAIESHILRFFPPDHRIPQSYAAIESGLVGLTPFELELDGARSLVLSATTVDALDRYLADAIAAEPLLLQAFSPLADTADSALPAGLRARRLDAALSANAKGSDAALARFVWNDGDRMVVRTNLAASTSSSNACDALVKRLRARLVDAFPAGVEARITGAATLLIHGQVLLLETQVRSFVIALGVVTLVIAGVFRSPALVAISLVPNLIPIVLTLGLMGWLAVPLDTATVTVAGIALGLIVDDTIHILYGYWDARRGGVSAQRAVAATLFSVGRPVLVTSVAVALGFGAFAFSPFRPTRYFGLLLSWASLAALLCDLVLLPALLQLRARGAARENVSMENLGGTR